MSFEDILMESIDEALASTMGKNCQQTVYYHLKNEFNLSKQEIPLQIKHFAESLETIFGEGAKILEIKIIEKLFKKLGCINTRLQDQKNLEFTTYIETAKQSYSISTSQSLTLMLT
jgi:hypothetical protein